MSTRQNLGMRLIEQRRRRSALPYLVFSTQPGGANSGSAFSPQPVVTAKNPDGTTKTSFTGNVTLAVNTVTGSHALGGTVTVAAVAGVATFSGVTDTGSGDGTLTATATGYSSATSASFTTSAASVTYELRDDFTDVDGTLLQSHTPTWAGGAGVGAWAKVQVTDPDMEIRSGEIFSVTDNVQCSPYGATLSASNAQVRVTDFRKVSATHRLWGFRLRWLNSSVPTCYQIQYDSTQWIVNAFVAGTGTQVGAAYPDTIAVGIAHATFGARVTTPDPAGAPNTHLIEILINGSVVHSVTHTGADPALAGAVGSRRVGVTTKGASTTGYTCTAIEAWVP